jgi:tRNA dimethylallyltransferase
MDPRYCIVIAGPTGVGKTALAAALARRWNTQVLSADSRQCYAEMNIGVARPTAAEMQGVPHHFIASHSILSPVNAADFERYALSVAEEVFRSHPILIVTGGTGLYIKAFLQGIDEMPFIPGPIRDRVRELYASEGLAGLKAAFPESDRFLETGEISNPHRVMRALEVQWATGRSIRDLQTGVRVEREFKTLYLSLDLPRPELYKRIDKRVDSMMRLGLLDEVKSLVDRKDNVCLQTVGYKELFEHLEGKHDLTRAVDLIKQHTRNYAKRQLTWFRSVEHVEWFGPGDLDAIADRVAQFTGMEAVQP